MLSRYTLASPKTDTQRSKPHRNASSTILKPSPHACCTFTHCKPQPISLPTPTHKQANLQRDKVMSPLTLAWMAISTSRLRSRRSFTDAGGCSGALGAADDLSAEDGGGFGRCVLGLWGRHCCAEEGGILGWGFYTRRIAHIGLCSPERGEGQEQRYDCAMHLATRVPRRRRLDEKRRLERSGFKFRGLSLSNTYQVRTPGYLLGHPVISLGRGRCVRAGLVLHLEVERGATNGNWPCRNSLEVGCLREKKT